MVSTRRHSEKHESTALREKALGPERSDVGTSLNKIAELYQCAAVPARRDRSSPNRVK
jgi:hypothetical protein